MATEVLPMPATVCINDALTDDELRSVLAKLESEQDKELFGLVCKRWLRLQSTERKKLFARAGPHMLERMAARFSRLLELDLSQSVSRSFYPGVTDSDLSVIADGFECLRVLNLQNCKGITDKGIVAIGNGLSSLQSLDLSYCRKLTDKGLLVVARGCPKLLSLHLAGCRLVTDEVLRALSKNCPNIEELGLQGCTNITDSGLADLVSGCREIMFLDINKCSNIGDIGVSSVSEACATSLKTLKLLDCYKIGNASILSLARFCKNLETLIIGGCRDITDESIQSLATACEDSLKNLRMDWCLNISNSSLSCILIKCRNLEALDIGCCEEVSDAAFEGLTSRQTELTLKVLKVNNCPKITVAGIGWLLDKCNSLEYLDVRSCPHITESGLQFPDYCKVNFTGNLSKPNVLL
ncbi:F-box/LRR-repeat protein 4 [Humulus lupulus]|uniref:F-box/LRR-repeat protein 4 n=1 Tax=Humulus lupulus TaxID=3486 RepID=UPI002B40316F|nr:F-box/LRR-repeat protein 4 [Humulus lupulus]